MAEVKWIKIVTDIFDDEKILLIESLPDKYAIIVCWFKLLCLAGKQNNNGVFMMNQRIAYTDEMLATIFRMPINTVRMALNTFQEFGMIEMIDGVITIPNWDKHQSLDAYEKKKAYDRQYRMAQREKQRLLAAQANDNRTDSRTTVVAPDKIREEEIREEEIRGDKEDVPDINVGHKPPKVVRHKYGLYEQVLLTDEDYEKLKAEFPHDYSERISRLDEYIASTGKKYKNHLATIRSWARKDKSQSRPTAPKKSSSFLDLVEDEYE